jgi:integrase
VSVHKDRGKWKVRWRDATGRQRSKSFDRRRDANEFDSHVRWLRQISDLPQLDAGTETLSEHVEVWWRDYATQVLAKRTLTAHAAAWDLHIEPYLGSVRLRDLDPRIVQAWLADLAAKGVGLSMRRRAKSVLSGVVERAVEWGRIRTNPVRVAKLPPDRRDREVQPMPPRIVEAMRARLNIRDATFVSVLAYSGPRPSEALGLRWRDVKDGTLLFHATKTSRRLRSVPLLTPLALDLNEWRMASGRPDESALVFPRSDGGQQTDNDLHNWRSRVFRPAARAAGLVGAVRPYDLRHAAASLWIHEGRSIVEVAAWLGNSPSVAANTYAHVIEELSRQPLIKAEDAIREAREVSREFPDEEAATGA